MADDKYKVGDRVIVSATATGTGADIPGRIVDIENFYNATVVSVSFDYPSFTGVSGICITNLGLITKE